MAAYLSDIFMSDGEFQIDYLILILLAAGFILAYHHAAGIFFRISVCCV